jgi:hypothetical protein
MPDRIRIMPYEAVPLCGSFEKSVSSVAVVKNEKHPSLVA